MAPVDERGALYIGGHFLSTAILIRRDDLLRFRGWDDCAAIEVEHASHGERILTLMNMAAEFERQEAAISSRRKAGRRRILKRPCTSSTSDLTTVRPPAVEERALGTI